MTAIVKIIKGAKYVVALTTLGVLLAGCNRTSDQTPPANNSGAPATPAAPDTTTPPPAPATPAPDTSATPPSGDTSSSSASDMAHSAGNAVDDTVITGKVKASLMADSDVKGTDIKVETNNGDVTLSGTAATQAQIDKAEGIARGIEGVKNVDNKLVVKAG